jgi:CheY-like chemotaxis protein
MSTGQQAANPRVAPEIAVTLVGRRFGLIGFEGPEMTRISGILRAANSLSTRFDETWLGGSSHLADALLVKLGPGIGSALRAAAASAMPALIVGRGAALLEGVAGAYGWPGDFLAEPWSDAELLVRLFRMVAPAREYAAHSAHRPQPLILLADDDPAWIALVEATLRTHGLAGRTSNDGLTTLRLARQLLPDLVLLDVNMPGMDGFEVLATIRQEPHLEHLPVALLTGCNDVTEVTRGAELHADDYMVKPMTPTVLLNRIKRLLAAHPPQRAAVPTGLPGGPLPAEPSPAVPATVEGS